MDIGSVIKKFREDRNMTHRELAEKLGVSSITVSRWEKNASTPSIPFLIEISSLFSVSVDNLLGLEDRAKEQSSVDFHYSEEILGNGLDADILSYEEACQIQERNLFLAYQTVSGCLQGLYQLSLEQGCMEQAFWLVDKLEEFIRCFEMGKYHEISARLETATLRRDANEILPIMEEMLSSAEKAFDFRNGRLYEHMSWQSLDEEYATLLRRELLGCFSDERSYGFLKEDPRWKDMMKKWG